LPGDVTARLERLGLPARDLSGLLTISDERAAHDVSISSAPLLASASPSATSTRRSNAAADAMPSAKQLRISTMNGTFA
jgi:hypothetical protein